MNNEETLQQRVSMLTRICLGRSLMSAICLRRPVLVIETAV
jgi:hypothetical protein